MTTRNIPTHLPIKCSREEVSKILNWISKRPSHELDSAVNRRCRWVYTVSDHGIFTDITVTDSALGETFRLDVEVESL